MLNISDNKIPRGVHRRDYRAFSMPHIKELKGRPVYFSLGLLVISIIFLCLPWTQNIQAKGYLTTLRPEERPQAIQSVISGRLENWYVKEGDFVEAGDTIVFISEVKGEYFDPDIVERASEQLDAKSASIGSYGDKVVALEDQYDALVQARDLKMEQTKNKIEQIGLKIISDSIDLEAYRLDLLIAERQLIRTQELYDKGLKPLIDLEEKRIKVQKSTAKVQVQQNKLANLRNDLINSQIELPSIQSQYAEKLSKARSDKFSAVTSRLDAQEKTAKLRNQLSNYQQRQKFYHILAPQSGYITKTIKKGVGEIIKEGTDILTIMPETYQLAVELYVKPRDLPLLNIGNRVNLLFDGWPAIVFSGWPNATIGSFDGKVVAIDQFISDNGEYRLLIAPSIEEKEWPDLIRVGSGARAFIMLKNVSVGYEIWRQLNGFPPDFYGKNGEKSDEVKRKAPLKSVK